MLRRYLDWSIEHIICLLTEHPQHERAEVGSGSVTTRSCVTQRSLPANSSKDIKKCKECLLFMYVTCVK